MPDLEFTGERVIPGLVEANLYNEHIARYRLAARFIAKFAPGGRVLDAGCGSGYGSAEFEDAGFVVAADAANDAVQYARAHFAKAPTVYAQARCEVLPFADQSFEVVVAFEVIEHLENWRGLLTETRRVLREGGILLVSTPNRSFYAETRSHAGPNPFHVHEFDHAEFASALGEVFPHVAVWRENHGEGIVFAAPQATAGEMEIVSQGVAEEAHFFLGICSSQPLPAFADTAAPAFAWMPEDGNLLQTRARHIALLSSEVEQKTTWLGNLQTEHAALVCEHKAVVKELERSNHWATELNARIGRSKQEIDRRDRDLESRRSWIERLQAEISDRESSIVAWQEKNASLGEELKATHAGYQKRLDVQAAEFAETVHQWTAETARVQLEAEKTAASWSAELQKVGKAYELRIGSLDEEAAQTRAAYEANYANIEAELAGVHRHYAATDAALRTAYDDEIRRITAELATVHAGYQKAIGALESELAGCREVYGRVERALEAAQAQLRAVKSSTWNRLGRVAGLGPKVNAD